MMKMITTRDALLKIDNKKAKLLSQYKQTIVWNCKIVKKPKIISLNSIQLKQISQKCIVKRLSDKVLLQRDNWSCQYCGIMVYHDTYTKDHVIPRCQGGKSTSDNLVICCLLCNSKKADRTPQEANMKLLKPIKQIKMFDPTKQMKMLYDQYFNQPMKQISN